MTHYQRAQAISALAESVDTLDDQALEVLLTLTTRLVAWPRLYGQIDLSPWDRAPITPDQATERLDGAIRLAIDFRRRVRRHRQEGEAS